MRILVEGEGGGGREDVYYNIKNRNVDINIEFMGLDIMNNKCY